MNRNQDASKKEVKKDKSLSLKVASGNTSDEEEDMAYLTSRFLKIVRKHRGFRKGEISGRTATPNDLCHKYYPRLAGDKDKRRDLISDRMGRRVFADYVVKKALAVWGYSSSDLDQLEHPEDVSMLTVKDDENVFNTMFTLMEKSDDEESKKEVTLSDIKQDLHTYSVKKLRNLEAIWIDSITELMTENDLMNNSLDIFYEEKVGLVENMSIVEEQLLVLETENLELKEKMKMMSEKYGREKGEASNLQLELETQLNSVETKPTLA
ncbi:hypothetical protein R3W88_024286 [Solanum pinnatisectum]|uniref:Uncharacterized protein n=1 Tax=Solanum pinnatisectum TaxID=50273 RepID=A0AAV9M0T3_9SOLN|nr:hypothetical protein R3W88_024286 [Solanum pinnatisectum]